MASAIKQEEEEFKNYEGDSNDDVILQLKETIEVLEAKMNKLHQILGVKDEKIRILEDRMNKLAGYS